MSVTGDSRLLVRVYSFEAEDRNPPGSDAHTLARIVAEGQEDRDTAIDPWRRFFEPRTPSQDSDGFLTAALDVETAALREKWMLFRESCPDAEQLDLTTSQPTVKSVKETVQAVQTAWESSQRQHGRFNKAKKFFHRFCGTLNSHKMMMAVLPSGNEYISIFTGVLNVIIHASANHEKVVEDLSNALCTIGEHVNDCATDQELFQTEDLQKLIADLYAHIFLFLTSVMDWMMKRRRQRLLDSFKEDLPSVIENDMEKIRGISDRIRYLAAQSSRAEARSTRLALEDLARDVRIGLEGERRHQAEMIQHAEAMRREQERSSSSWSFEKRQQLAETIVDLLEDKALSWLETAREPQGWRYNGLHKTTAFAVEEPKAKVQHTSEEVALNSRFLEDYFDRDRVRLPYDAFNPVMVDAETVSHISDWAKAPPPDLLWLEGDPMRCDDFDNPVTMMAARVVGLADQLKTPVVSYFCELRRDERLRDGNGSREAQALVGLVYSLIRQLLELLPPAFESSSDLSTERFRSLDGTIRSWNTALSVIADLVDTMPGSVFCIIDGLHWLNDRSTDDRLPELLKVLRGGKLKVLLSTSGRSVVLRDELSRSETVHMRSRQPPGRGIPLDRKNFSGRG
ncbi:hypothetical protein CH35J_001997 [Colletotrichum higginsianum]|uniref:Phytanoyl-dioxygenase family protein n=2 Tax=Colletotrichum higginsianum TaxID=80884 RepID=A0A4V4NDP6_9PEZI|nr:hypothetical protein CH35J_001997 [Colletotrichum higginsianum]